jgi:hypothetical protein
MLRQLVAAAPRAFDSPAVASLFFCCLAVIWMATNTIDGDVHALKEWLRRAWRTLADPALTSYERRELRNYIKEANGALRSGLKQITDRDAIRREAVSDILTISRPNFRILQLDA